MPATQRRLPHRIGTDVRRSAKERGVDTQEAFCQLAMQAIYGLDEADADEATSFTVVASEPSGAFWHDEDNGRVVLVQARYATAGTARVDQRAILELTDAWAKLDPVEKGPASEFKETTAAFELARERDPELTVELLYVVAGTFTRGARAVEDEFNEGHSKKKVQLRLADLETLQDADLDRRSREAGPVQETIALQLRNHFQERSNDGEAPTLVASIDGTQLAQIEQKHRFRIFERNVRYQLPAGGKINKNIANTLKDPDGRRKFWYFNNGISIVCDAYRLDGDVVHVKNLQIVNGCQTTTTLGENLSSLTNPAPTVLVRIIASTDPELQRDITLYNNRQNAVRDRDLLSNDPIQDELARGFAQLRPPWYYERKRGAWKAELSASQRKAFGSHQIHNEKAAQAAYAFYFDPGEARARKRLLFVTRRDNPNGFYERLFNRSTTPEWLLLPHLVNEFVAGQKRLHARQLKDAEGKKPAQRSIADKLALQRTWIKFADQAFVGAFALYWRPRLKGFSQSHIAGLLKDRQFDRLLSISYQLALRDLSVHFRNLATEAHEQDRVFVPANYLKGNWHDIARWLEAQEEYRDGVGEDPFADIPRLARG